jgi:hypothetical protein
MLIQMPEEPSIPRTGTARAATTPVKRHNGRFARPALPRVATESTSHGRNARNSQAERNRLRKMSVNTAG